MSEHKVFIAKLRQWIALNSGSNGDSRQAPISIETGRLLAKEYCEWVDPLSTQLGQCAQWARNGLYVEACSVCDDWPDLLEVA